MVRKVSSARGGRLNEKSLYPWFFFLVSFLFALSPTACLHEQDLLDSKVESQKTEVEKMKAEVEGFGKTIQANEKGFEDLKREVKQERADTQVLIQDLRIEIQGLRGDLEELSHNMDLLKNDVEKVRSHLQKAELEKVTRAESDLTVYDRILKIVLEEKDYELAIRQFRRFIADYPNSTLADNASYWMGEGYYAQGKYKEAILEFQNLLEKYPKSDKICAGLLKQAFSFENLDKPDKAKLFFEETLSRCENRPEAKTAKARMERLKQPKKKK